MYIYTYLYIVNAFVDHACFKYMSANYPQKKTLPKH